MLGAAGAEVGNTFCVPSNLPFGPNESQGAVVLGPLYRAFPLSEISVVCVVVTGIAVPPLFMYRFPLELCTGPE